MLLYTVKNKSEPRGGNRTLGLRAVTQHSRPSRSLILSVSSAQEAKPLRGGRDPGLVHNPSASATRPIDSDFAPCLYQRAAPCYSSAWLRLAAASVRFFTSRSPGTLPRTRPLPIYPIYVEAKAVPVAASSSEIASARPTGPEFRPRSFKALRIQHSSKDATAHSALSFATGPNRRISRQREAPAVGLDASACAGRRSECVIRDQPRTNRPSRPLFFVRLLSQGLILRVPGHVGRPDRGQSLRQHPSSYHRISIPSQETDGE